MISHVFLAWNTEHFATPRAAVATISAMRWWFVALALAVVPRSLGAQPLAEPPGGTPRIAVVPTIVVRLDVARVDALAQELAAALHDELEVEAIGGVEVRRRLPGYGSLPDCVATPACITDAARRLDAQQLLFLVVIGTASGAIQIDATWIDPITHRSASRPAINLATLADAPNQFASAAHQLLPDARIRSRPPSTIGRMAPAVPRHFTLPSYLTAGATAVGLATGISFGLVVRGRYRDCESAAANGVACSSGRRDSIRRLALLADAGWLLAIGGTITTAVIYATSDESPHVLVEPMPGGAAISAVGSF